jgi:hypothetical protein
MFKSNDIALKPKGSLVREYCHSWGRSCGAIVEMAGECTMNQRWRTVISLLVGGLVVSAPVAVQPAAAAPVASADVVAGDRAPRPGGNRPHVVDDTGWAPAFTTFEAGGGACGGIVTGGPKDQDNGTREQQTVTYRNGDVVTRWRGSVTLSLHMVDDGWPGNPVFPAAQDYVVSGAVTRVDYASGAVLLKRVAPGIIAVHTSPDAPGPEQVAFTQAGLPSVYLLKRGTFTEYLRPDRKVLKIVRASTRLANVCDAVGYADFRDHTVLVYDSSGIGAPIYAG